jgi:hypothetical protein
MKYLLGFCAARNASRDPLPLLCPIKPIFARVSCPSNGATGMSDMAGYAATVAVEPSGSERDTMERLGRATRLRQGYGVPSIEGKVAREAMSEWSHGDASDIDGQTERSNGAFGQSDMEGKAAMGSGE